MLFSNEAVRDTIRTNFLAAWENVRAVPLVTIDFGDGTTLKRTVNGNVATYVCMPDGRVIDIIPGVNTPEAYLAALKKALTVYRAAVRGADPREYHRVSGKTGAYYVLPTSGPAADFSKSFRIERPLLVALKSKPGKTADRKAGRTPLEMDTDHNTRVRKPIVHRILAERAWTPGELTKRVYREVLDCDLDDPYLGLARIDFNGGGYDR